MAITIYFDDRALVIASEEQTVSKNFAAGDGVSVVESGTQPNVAFIINALETGKSSGATVYAHDVADTFRLFQKEMVTIKAGGGLVYTPEKDVLMIFRKKKWDLPKGKLDAGETIEAAALREVEEETGLGNLKMQSFLQKTYHTYREKGKLILKESHWYLMESAKTENLVPQQEEDIEACVWVPLSNLLPYLENAHPSVKDVLAAGKAALEK